MCYGDVGATGGCGNQVESQARLHGAPGGLGLSPLLHLPPRASRGRSLCSIPSPSNLWPCPKLSLIPAKSLLPSPSCCNQMHPQMRGSFQGLMTCILPDRDTVTPPWTQVPERMGDEVGLHQLHPRWGMRCPFPKCHPLLWDGKGVVG